MNFIDGVVNSRYHVATENTLTDLAIYYDVSKFKNYGEPINAGERINTKYNEITPFYNIWTGELFFSSDRDDDENGIDIYKSSGSLNLWNMPEKVEELNSKEDVGRLRDEGAGDVASGANAAYNAYNQNRVQYPNVINDSNNLYKRDFKLYFK